MKRNEEDVMVKFGELTSKDKQAFDEELEKSKQKQSSVETNEELWPDDDEESVAEYFKKSCKQGG